MRRTSIIIPYLFHCEPASSSSPTENIQFQNPAFLNRPYLMKRSNTVYIVIDKQTILLPIEDETVFINEIFSHSNEHYMSKSLDIAIQCKKSWMLYWEVKQEYMIKKYMQTFCRRTVNVLLAVRFLIGPSS